ncbi:MAG: tetratricopeptide repeat protein [Euryarchaeota archaeon]|nr:tetratricopeptide repeat protein [Euryarchaeota archaeon]
MPKRGALSVWESIVLHLARFSRFAGEFEVPGAVVQEGVADGAGVTRAHAAVELKKLRDKNLITERLAHVRGAKTKKKAYFLTADGEASAKQMRESALKSRLALVTLDGEERELPGAECLRYLTGAVALSEVDAIKAMLGGERVDARLLAKVEKEEPGGLQMAEGFVGRADELAALRRWLSSGSRFMVVQGLHGIGKSSLVAAALDGAKGAHVYRPTLMDTPGHMLAFMLRSLSGRPAGLADPRESFVRLLDAGSGALFVVEGYEAAARSLDPFLSQFLAAGKGPRFIIASAIRPRFYSSSDVAQGGVREIPLSGLSKADSLTLLERKGAAKDVAERIYSATGGHPLSMLLAPRDAAAGKGTLTGILQKAVSSLDREEAGAIVSLAIFRKPVPPIAARVTDASLASALAGKGFAVEDREGNIIAHPCVREAVLSRLGAQQLKVLHSKAADYWLDAGGYLERLHHLVEAQRHGEARMLLTSRCAELEGEAGPSELLATVRGVEIRDRDVRYRLALAGLALDAGQHQAALAYSTLKATPGDRALGAEATVIRARVLTRLGKIAEAETALESAAPDADGDAKLELERLLGSLRMKRGQYDEARSSFARVFEAASGEAAAEAANQLANIDLMLGNFKEASRWLEAGIDACGGGATSVALRANYALASASRGKEEEALGHFGAALKEARRLGLPMYEAEISANMSDLLSKGNKCEEALPLAERSVELLRSLGVRDRLGLALLNMGRTLACLKRRERALETLDEAVSLNGFVADPRARARRLLDASESYAMLGATAKSKEMKDAARANGGKAPAKGRPRRKR